jgi:diaminopimelate epimerase
MKRIVFAKMVASGNDFVVMHGYKKLNGLNKLALQLCNRKYGIGADGLLLLNKTGSDSINMRIFNADGSEAQMCGNGARCAALYSGRKNLNIKTIAGVIKAQVSKDDVKIRLTDPKNLRTDIKLKINAKSLSVNFINTGVPHVVIPVSGLEKIDASGIGRQVRYNRKFAPAGTNVNFIEVINKNSIKVRTYERGVEDETLACGTGSVASALIFALKTGLQSKVNVLTRSGEILKVYFIRTNNHFSDVWLQGKARLVYKGEYLCSGAR